MSTAVAVAQTTAPTTTTPAPTAPANDGGLGWLLWVVILAAIAAGAYYFWNKRKATNTRT
jgi:uncharacterized protein HemX